MKATSTRPKLNAAFKIVQPLPVLSDNLRLEFDAAAPRFDTNGRATGSTENLPHPARKEPEEITTRAISRRGLSAAAGRVGIAQSCVALAELPPQAQLSRGLEVRLVA